MFFFTDLRFSIFELDFGRGGFDSAQPPSAPLNHHRLRSTTIDSAQPPSTPLNHH